MNELDALRLMAKHYPGGLEVLALRISKPAETLRKELAGAPGFKLGLQTASLIRDLCIEAQSEHCMAFTNAVCGQSGGFVRLPIVDMSESPSVHGSVGEMVRGFGDAAASVLESDADGDISDNELKRDLRVIAGAAAALQRVEQALRSKHAAGKAARGLER